MNTWENNGRKALDKLLYVLVRCKEMFVGENIIIKNKRWEYTNARSFVLIVRTPGILLTIAITGTKCECFPFLIIKGLNNNKKLLLFYSLRVIFVLSTQLIPSFNLIFIIILYSRHSHTKINTHTHTHIFGYIISFMNSFFVMRMWIKITNIYCSDNI